MSKHSLKMMGLVRWQRHQWESLLKIIPSNVLFLGAIWIKQEIKSSNWCLEQQLVRESVVWVTTKVTFKRQRISSLWSSAKLGVEHPNSSQRDVESGEKSRCWVESFTGNQQIQEPDHEFLGESAPHAGFYPQLPPLSWVSRILQSCSSRQTIPSASVPWNPRAARPSLRGGSRRIPSSEVSAPAAPLDTCPVLSAAAEVDFSLELIA